MKQGTLISVEAQRCREILRLKTLLPRGEGRGCLYYHAGARGRRNNLKKYARNHSRSVIREMDPKTGPSLYRQSSPTRQNVPSSFESRKLVIAWIVFIGSCWHTRLWAWISGSRWMVEEPICDRWSEQSDLLLWHWCRRRVGEIAKSAGRERSIA